MKQLELWQDADTPPPIDQTDDESHPHTFLTTCNELAGLSVTGADRAVLPPPTESVREGPPLAVPVASAVEAGVFGVTDNGPIDPDEVQVSELTAEHANEMIILLADSQVLEEALRLEYDPATGRAPSNAQARQALLARLDKEWKRLVQAYADAVAAYADGFGDVAAEALDQWCERLSPMASRKRNRIRLRIRGITFTPATTHRRFRSTR